MMDIDEAIKHAEEVANEKERLGAMGRGNPDKYAASPEQCFKCAEEHRQLAEWLKELKRVREQPWLKELKMLREQKRPRGEWILEAVSPHSISWFRCSYCGYKYNEYKQSNFCPNCGVPMNEKAFRKYNGLKEGDENVQSV